MIHAEGALRRTGVGHPPIDDREQVLGYFAGHLPMGLSVSKIAKPGLKIYGYALGPDGRTKQLTVLRELKASTLERGRVRQGGVISAVAVGHRQAALAVMCRG